MTPEDRANQVAVPMYRSEAQDTVLRVRIAAEIRAAVADARREAIQEAAHFVLISTGKATLAAAIEALLAEPGEGK